MLSTMFARYFNGVLLLTAALGGAPTAAAGQTAAAQAGAESNFTVFLQGVPIGTERTTVASAPDSHTITGSGGVGAPLNVQTIRLEMKYDGEWKPIELTLEAIIAGRRNTLNTKFAGTLATSAITQGELTTTKTDTVAPDAIVLPNPFFSAYEALSARLGTAKPGSELRAYLAPQAEIAIHYATVSEERIQTPGRTIVARRHTASFATANGPVVVEIWGEQDTGRLLRLRIPAQQLEVVRQDLSSVATRVEVASREGDEQVRIQGNGFSLAATIAVPKRSGAAQKRPNKSVAAVILVPPFGPEDRDVVIVGIPIFAQIAAAVADAGFLAVRYDKRGVGQSGGRAEAVALDDYAEDVRAVVRFLRKRKEIDPERIAALGYGDGGWMALLAASKEKSIAAVALLATASSPGSQLVLEQQRRALDRMNLTPEEKQARVALQEKIHTATLSGNGWGEIPIGLRRQADTPWFRSFLGFDPLKVFARVRQPVLVLGGGLDREIDAVQADRFAAAARTRKGSPAFERVTVDEVNHLLVPAVSGEIDEYAGLTDRHVSASVLAAVTSWLSKVLSPRASR
jgi:pimeloyl-ACP methyl ester carboxylesterase